MMSNCHNPKTGCQLQCSRNDIGTITSEMWVHNEYPTLAPIQASRQDQFCSHVESNEPCERMFISINFTQFFGLQMSSIPFLMSQYTHPGLLLLHASPAHIVSTLTFGRKPRVTNSRPTKNAS